MNKIPPFTKNNDGISKSEKKTGKKKVILGP